MTACCWALPCDGSFWWLCLPPLHPNGPVPLHGPNPCGKLLSPVGAPCASRVFICLSRCFAAVEIFLLVRLSEVYNLPLALPSHFLQDADSSLCLLQPACPPQEPPSPPPRPAATTLGSGLSSAPIPLVCHSQLLPRGLICYSNSSSQPSYPVSAPRCTYQNRGFQLFPRRGWEQKATLGMPSWSGDFSALPLSRHQHMWSGD